MSMIWESVKGPLETWEKAIGDSLRLKIVYVEDAMGSPWQYDLEYKPIKAGWVSIGGSYEDSRQAAMAMAEKLLDAPLKAWLEGRRHFTNEFMKQLNQIESTVENYQRKAHLIAQVKGQTHKTNSFYAAATSERYMAEGYLYSLSGVPYLQQSEDGDGSPNILSEHEMLCYGGDRGELTFFLSHSANSEEIEVVEGTVSALSVDIGYYENDGTVKFTVVDLQNRKGQGSYVMVAIVS